jgi:hypothetical protein
MKNYTCTLGVQQMVQQQDTDSISMCLVVVHWECFHHFPLIITNYMPSGLSLNTLWLDCIVGLPLSRPITDCSVRSWSFSGPLMVHRRSSMLFTKSGSTVLWLCSGDTCWSYLMGNRCDRLLGPLCRFWGRACCISYVGLFFSLVFNVGQPY